MLVLLCGLWAAVGLHANSRQNKPEDYVLHYVSGRHLTCGNIGDVIQIVGITLEGKSPRGRSTIDVVTTPYPLSLPLSSVHIIPF